MALEARVSQLPIMVVATDDFPARVSQLGITVIYVPPKTARVSQLPITVVFPLEANAPRGLLPDWPATEVWEWKTTVAKTYSGREQRMALRQDPKIRVQYNLPLVTADDRVAALHLLHRYQGKFLNYPLFHHGTAITTAGAVSDTELVFTPTESWMRDNEPVAVYNSEMTYFRVFQTGAVTSTGIALAEALDEVIPAGYIVAPCPSCRLPTEQSLSMGILVGAATLDLEVTLARDLLRQGQSVSLTTFDSLPLLPDYILTDGAGINIGVNRNYDITDIMTNDPISRATWIHPQWSLTRSYLLRRSNLDLWRKFGDTIRGSQGVFLVPSFDEDIRLNAVPALSATTLTTADPYAEALLRPKGNRYLRMETANGVIYRKVTDVTLNMDRTVKIRLATALGGSTGDNTITKVSLMHKVRLADDQIQFTHLQYDYIVAALNLVTVEE